MPETEPTKSLDSVLNDIRTRPELGRYFLLVATEDRQHIGNIPLMLDGSESLEAAKSRFTDAIVVGRQNLAVQDNYGGVGARGATGDGIDGKPRTRREITAADYYAKADALNWIGTEDTDEFHEFMAAREEELHSRGGSRVPGRLPRSGGA